MIGINQRFISPLLIMIMIEKNKFNNRIRICFYMCLLSIIVLYCCNNNNKDIPIPMNSKNIKRKQFDLYYAKYTSNKNLSAIISDIDKKMSDWIEIDLTGCNNKLGIFNKIINGKLVPISYFN